MKLKKYIFSSCCFFLFLISCTKDEPIKVPDEPTIEEFSATIGMGLLNQSNYIGYMVSNQRGEIIDYGLTNGTLLQEDVQIEMQKRSDEEIAVTLISEHEYLLHPEYSNIELTTFADLPSGAVIETNPTYLFGWTNADKNIELFNVEEFDLVLFPKQSSSWDAISVTFLGTTLSINLRLPNTFENFILIKANGEDQFRYITLGKGETGVQASFNDLPFAAEKEIYMPSYGTWNGYVFGNNAATGNKMLLYGEISDGQNSGRVYKVYYPAEIDFSNVEFYLDNGFSSYDNILVVTYNEIPSAIIPNDQLGILQDNVGIDSFKIKLTESTDLYEMRYYRNTSDSDFSWEISGYADKQTVEFVLPDIPQEIENEFPADLILDRRFKYGYLYISNIQSDFSPDFWQNPPLSKDFDWMLENGLYRKYQYYNF